MNFTSHLDGAEIWERIKAANLPWTVDGSAVLMGVTQSGGIPEEYRRLCDAAIKEIQWCTGLKARHVMVNRLPAGVIVPIHTDAVIDWPDRWHLPLVTDEKHCVFWDELRGFQFFSPGYWYRVDYRINHTIMNLGQTERVHLIVDVIP